jgi:hypothetical protein
MQKVTFVGNLKITPIDWRHENLPYLTLKIVLAQRLELRQL